MTPSLDTLTACFQGLIPSMLFTCSADGTPNAAYLSHVDYVDSTHVALSFQFFNKSRRNVAENPKATIKVIDPDTGKRWMLSLRFVRSETSGPLFERMALRIESIASYCGLKGIFKLLAADVYEVTRVRPAEDCAATPQDRVEKLLERLGQALQHMSTRITNPESQLGIPLLVRGEIVGVLCVESEIPYRFHEDDKTSIELLGSYLAIAIQHMQMHERAEAAASAIVAEPAVIKAVAAARSPGRGVREVVFYSADECILVDGEYLIRSLPARILWKLLSARTREGRAEFTNRELRLDKSLNLPEWKDNLETRLLLLRRRLEQKCPDIRVVPRGRGRFGVELGCQVALTERP